MLQVLCQVEGLNAFVQSIDVVLKPRLHENVVVAHFLVFDDLPRYHIHLVPIIPFRLVITVLIGRRIHEMLNVAEKGSRLVENILQLLGDCVVVVLQVGLQLISVEERETRDINLDVFVPFMCYSL